jgi:MFS family permease
MGFVADRINKKIMVVIGGMIVGYAILSFTWVENFGDMALAAIIFGIGGGVSMPALMAMAALKGNTSGSMGSVMALMNVAHSLGMLTGALIGGLMMDVYKLQWAFPAGAFIMIICSGVFLISTYRQKAAALAKFDPH